MHVLHFVATQADSSKDAFSNVKSSLEDRASGGHFWSDWHVVGGGRWSQNSKDGYSDTEKDVISYVKNKKKFIDSIEWTKEARKQEMKTLLSSLQENDGEAQFFISALEYIKKADGDSLGMNAYYVHRISEMLLGHWTSDSYFYDLDSNSCSYTYIEERIKEEPSKVYLVPVDFHF